MRIHWIDNLKWIGIILIVLWHCYFPDKSLFISYIFSFHVILFFFLSGLLFHDKKYQNFFWFAKNKAQRLLIPYIWFNVIMFSILKGKDFITHQSDFWVSFFSFLQWTFYWSYLIIPDSGNYFLIPDHTNITNVPTWFLVCLFICSIFYFFLNKYIKNRTLKILILVWIAGSIFLESKYFNFRFPFSSEIALMSMFFYWLWHTFQKEIMNFAENINKKYLFLLPILIWINILFLSNVNINFSSNYYWENFFLFIINGFLWVISYIIIAKNIPQNKILDFFGQNSIIILWFEWVKFILLSIVIKLSFWYLMFEKSYLNGTIQLIITLWFLSVIIFLINKYFRFVLWDTIKK